MEGGSDLALLRAEPMQIYDYQRIVHPTPKVKNISDGEWEPQDHDGGYCVNKAKQKDAPAPEDDPMVTRKAHKIFPFTLYTVISFSHILLYRSDDCVVLRLTDQGIYRQISWVHHHMNNHSPKPHSLISSIHMLNLKTFTGLCIGDNYGTFVLYDLSSNHPEEKLMLDYSFHPLPLIQISNITLKHSKNNQEYEDTWIFLMYQDGTLSVIHLNPLLGYPSYPISIESSPGKSPNLLGPYYASCRLSHSSHDDYVHKSCFINVKQIESPTNKGFECLLICSHKEEYLFTIHQVTIQTTLTNPRPSSPSQWWSPNLAISSLQKFAQGIYQGVSPTLDEKTFGDITISMNSTQTSAYPRDGHRIIEAFFIPFNVVEQRSSFFKTLPVAMTDNLGRVLLFDIVTGCILYIWKGYRNATCQWLCASFEDDGPLYLAIYSPSRPQQCDVWKLPFDKNSSLLPELIKSVSLKNHEVVIPWSCTSINQCTLDSNKYQLICSANHNATHMVYDTLLLLHRNKGHIRHIGLKDIEK